jgi:hypothetical protein
VATAHSPGDVWARRAIVEWYWQGKPEDLGEKPFPMPLCPPQIPHGLTQARTWVLTVRSQELTAWATITVWNIPWWRMFFVELLEWHLRSLLRAELWICVSNSMIVIRWIDLIEFIELPEWYLQQHILWRSRYHFENQRFWTFYNATRPILLVTSTGVWYEWNNTDTNN